MTTLRINEIFGPVIQGEGPMIGCPTIFVRAGGCDYRCIWCDTAHAVLPQYRHEWTPMRTAVVMEEIAALSGPITVTLSGGNPAIQPFGELIGKGNRLGYRFACETQGSVAAEWFSLLDHLILSPKGPSSGMETDWDVLAECVSIGNGGKPGVGGTALKIVVFNDDDYQFARKVADRFRAQPLFLQVGNDRPTTPEGEDPGFDPVRSLAQLRLLMDRVTGDKWTRPRVLPQLHALAYGNARGV
jgi:7-carboxy-7-deazaguanine synthase